MRTTEARMELIVKRTKKLKKENDMKRRRLMGAGCAAACFLFVAGLGAVMPALEDEIGFDNVSYGYGTASIIAKNVNSGYIMMGIFSFALGVCATLIIFRVLRGNSSGGDDECIGDCAGRDDCGCDRCVEDVIDSKVDVCAAERSGVFGEGDNGEF